MPVWQPMNATLVTDNHLIFKISVINNIGSRIELRWYRSHFHWTLAENQWACSIKTDVLLVRELMSAICQLHHSSVSLHTWTLPFPEILLTVVFLSHFSFPFSTDSCSKIFFFAYPYFKILVSNFCWFHVADNASLCQLFNQYIYFRDNTLHDNYNRINTKGCQKNVALIELAIERTRTTVAHRIVSYRIVQHCWRGVHFRAK